ncbi:GAF domain-containing protein [Geodermatophilus telluris]|uniref:GAF domain-containing protein n=1 Tax=Geodermatophilus telluris TaxID=1190417 RepID=A0A1G6JXF1_9ACTN|nr:GAF and ANTAR domain-containing protein [Geodermatophilus telluris]SDC23393.1 GAF domain-containing protein [Geodermatophilus telluris]
MPGERDFDERLAAVARELLNEPDEQHTLQRVVDAAAATLGPQVWASVSLVRQRREVDTPATSDDRAARADELQYELTEGPCLDAIWEQETFQIDDMTADERYPRWSRAVAEQTGIRSSLSLQLFTDADQESLGGLNLYSPRRGAFDAQTRGEALAFAAQAAVAVTSARTEEHLRSVMATRTLIGQAQGILMERLRITADQAFGVLSRLSQQSNVKLREIARRLVETGEVPRPPRTGHGGDPAATR